MDMEECRNAWTALCIKHQTYTKLSLDNTLSGFEIDSTIFKKIIVGLLRILTRFTISGSCSRDFVSGQSRPFWAVLKLL